MGEASRAWTWRHAFASSSLPATTRHVLHTLGMFMNELGEGCYPSVADICRYSGLDKKTVLKHLDLARETGWIAVSQHGYRGQKWKRNEYAARWPDRDTVAPCPPEEGGGAVPPPCDDEKAVESAPEGGGIEGSKVVEQLHQDKTSPETTPVTSPSERERGREEDRQEAVSAANREAEKPEGLTKRAEALFYRAFKAWDRFDVSPKQPMLAAWGKLTWTDMETSADAVPRFLAKCRAEGMKHAPAISTYLDPAERLWERFPALPQKPADIDAPVFGPVWSAARFRALLTDPPSTARPRPSAFIAALLARDDADGASARRAQQALYGWPGVNAMHISAENRRGIRVAAGSPLLALSGLMEAVPVDGPVWEAWRGEHERRGWPWLPDPGSMRVVWFPAGGPERLAEFEQAVRGGLIHDGQQAAE